MTYEELQDEVQRNVIDLPTAVQEGVPNYINRALKTLQGKYNFKVMEAEADYVTDVGVRLLDPSTMPTRFKDFRLEPFAIMDDGTFWELNMAPNRTALRRMWGDEDEGAPRTLFMAEPTSTDDFVGSLEVWPLPDGNSDYDDGEYRISFPYWAYVAPLSNNTDTNWFTTNCEEYLIFQATAEAFFVDWDESRAAVWTQRAGVKYEEAKMLDKRSRLTGTRELIPHWQGARKPFLRF